MIRCSGSIPEGTTGSSGVVALWRESVARSHAFLTDEDIERLVPAVRAAIVGAARLTVVERAGRPAAFMGVGAEKIEMLFVDPALFGCGLGRRLVGMAVGRWNVGSVDVNEQNPAARAFYERMGFRVAGRSGSDAQGNDFPILHMPCRGRGAITAALSFTKRADKAYRIYRVFVIFSNFAR